MPSMPEMLKVAGQELTVSTERTRHAVDYGVSASSVGSWTHVASTFDGVTSRLLLMVCRCHRGRFRVRFRLRLIHFGLVGTSRMGSVAELQTVMNGPLLSVTPLDVGFRT